MANSMKVAITGKNTQYILYIFMKSYAVTKVWVKFSKMLLFSRINKYFQFSVL